MYDSERFNGFIKTELDNYLYSDIDQYWVFNESDLHSAAYFYIRKFYRKRESDCIFVRCEPHFRGKRPDIVIFEDTRPIYVIELKMFPDRDAINEDKIFEDLDKLRVCTRADSVKWGFFILVCDLDKQYKLNDSWLRRHDYHKISVISINLRLMEETGYQRRGYENWRYEFDRLRTGQRQR